MAIKIIYNEEKGLYQVYDVVGGFILSSSLKTNTIAYATTTITTNYNLGNESVIFADASVGNLTITLPDVSAYEGFLFRIKKIDSTNNLVIVSGSLGNTIDGTMAKIIDAQYDAVSILSSGQEWFIV